MPVKARVGRLRKRSATKVQAATRAKPRREQSEKRPLWTCPACGHRFVTRNMWHSCRRYPLSYFFKNKDPVVRQLFDQYLALVSEFGPVIMSPVKTGIAFQVRVRFAGATPRKRWLSCALWLKRRVDHPLFYRIESVTPRDHIHRFRLTCAADLRDKNLKALLREAYAVGCQEHIYAR
jgi:predicted RNA-binding Zn-ribbon protein involved in translation (DUF1610 family)